ncbi:MAG: Na+/H+ antiporter subunit G [Paracoccaceae bacterium]
MPLWAEIAITVCLVIGGLFGLVGSFGLMRLPDPMQRLHAPTKAATVGVGAVLIASMLYFFADRGHISTHELLITLFIFLTAPITALFISKVHLHLKMRSEDLPTPKEGAGWAGYTATGPARGVRDMPEKRNE